jgi:hypothetical protein
MQVAFIPLHPQLHGEPIVVRQFPVVLTRRDVQAKQDADLPIEAMTVSERHCKIDEVDSLLVVCDLGSRHGTFVNEKRVRKALLGPGAKLTLGAVSYMVWYDSRLAAWHMLPDQEAASQWPASAQSVPCGSVPSTVVSS